MKTATVALLPLVLALAACESTSRFDGSGSAPPRVAVAQPRAPEPVMSAPTSPVSSEPLPPVGGGAPATPLSPPGTQVAVATPTAPAAPQPPSNRGVAGTWKISDAARGDCSISLTQQNLLDLYRATPNGCQAGSLAKVNAWQQRGQEIVLLESGGRTAVRLFPKGDGTYEGQATTSGAVIRMAK